MTPKQKAKRIQKELEKIAKNYGYTDMPKLNNTIIEWESGPSQWAILATGGDSIFCVELGRYDLTPEADLQALLKDQRFVCECGFSWTLEVYAS